MSNIKKNQDLSVMVCKRKGPREDFLVIYCGLIKIISESTQQVNGVDTMVIVSQNKNRRTSEFSLYFVFKWEEKLFCSMYL